MLTVWLHWHKVVTITQDDDLMIAKLAALVKPETVLQHATETRLAPCNPSIYTYMA